MAFVSTLAVVATLMWQHWSSAWRHQRVKQGACPVWWSEAPGGACFWATCCTDCGGHIGRHGIADDRVAEGLCNLRGGHLANIDNDAENSFVRSLITGDSFIWIGPKR